MVMAFASFRSPYVTLLKEAPWYTNYKHPPLYTVFSLGTV